MTTILLYPSASLIRRLCAILYDTLLLIALAMVGTFILLLFTQGHAITPHNLHYQLYLCCLIATFFVGFWTRGGQTVGMLAWQLKVVTLSGQALSIKQALVRLFLAILCLLLGGIGWIWVLWDPEKQTLYDRLSKTRLISLNSRKH